jgi:ABC-type multidrug transport system ATPase subunit
MLLFITATSALDAESEHLVQEAIDRLMRSRTVIVIAHRLSTVRDADQIAVFSKGQIAALGPHETLMRTCKLYQNLVRRQLQWGDKESSAALSTITSNDDDEEKDFENKTDFNFLETPMKSDPGVALKDADDNGE